MQSRGGGFGGGQWAIPPSAAFQPIREEEGGSFSTPTNGDTERDERIRQFCALWYRQGLAQCLAHRTT